MKQNKLNLFTAFLLFIAVGLGQNAQATTKTVTYRITDITQINNSWNIIFTRSGDTPFNTSAPTTYTAYVPSSYIEQTSGGAGGFSVELADGFSLNLHWGLGSDVWFTSNNCIFPRAENKYITYTVSCPNTNYYYVTHVMMTGTESGYQHGMIQTYPHNNEPIDYDYSNVWDFSESYSSRYSFGQITLTYTDVPALSIFESADTDTYNIKSKDDLRHLANYVNNGQYDCNGLTFLQTTDITCDNTYTPIGYYSSSDNASFSGTYNGQGHTISGITVSRTGNSNADGYLGIFGQVGTNGLVQNIVLASSTFTGYDRIGGIVGSMYGTVQNCRVESTVTIKAGHNSAYNHGGIAGYISGNNAKVIGCVSAATVSHNNKSYCNNYGGVAGSVQYGTIKDCLYTGTTIEAAQYKGAIVGDKNGGTFINNYYTSINLGGVGAQNSSSDQNGARLARTVTLGTNVALVGNETAYNLSGLTAIGTTALRYNNTLYSGATQTLTLRYNGNVPTGYSLNFTVTAGTLSGTTLTMPAENVTVTAQLTKVWSGNGTSESPYIISTTNQLDFLAKMVNGTDGYAANDFNGKYFKLDDNIEYDPTALDANGENYTAIGLNVGQLKFCGTFDGDGHTISGIRINKPSPPSTINQSHMLQGLFGWLEGGTIKNVTVSDASITGCAIVAALVGANNGTIENCQVTGTVSVTGTYNDAGGIVGQNNGTIKNCYVNGTVNVTSQYRVGGIAGNNHGTIENCLVLGTSVTATEKQGGSIVGYNEKKSGAYTGILSHNYYNGCTAQNGNTTATTNIGCGNKADSDKQTTDVTEMTINEVTYIDGARGVYVITLTDGVTATGESVEINGNTYYAAGTVITLGYTGTIPEGSSTLYVYNDGTDHIVSGNQLTMPAADVTVSGGAYKNDYITHWQASPAHDGSSDTKAYIITTPAGLQLLSSETKGGNNFSGTYFKLGGDIDMSGVGNFTPIGINSSTYFCGNFDGQNHTISHLTINYTSGLNAGLFGYLEGGNPFPVICNLTLDRANISGREKVGGIVGYQYHGTVSNCHVVNSTIRGTDTTPRVGAIVGHYYSTSYNSLSGSNYHSTLVYANSNVKAFNIGCGDWGTSSHQGGDSGGACLDATKLFVDNRTDLNELLAAYNDPASYTAYNGTAPVLSGLTATVRGHVTIPFGSVLEAPTINIATGGSLTLADGAELVSNNPVANVIVQKHIEHYTTDKNGWNLITMPYSRNYNPTLICNLIPKTNDLPDLTSTSYDLYQLYTPTTVWKNYKQHHGEYDNFYIGKETACLYANSADVTLQIDASINPQTVPYTEEGYSTILTQSGDNWNLIGNPYTFKAYADRPYYRMNATGTALELVENYWQVPINVCEGIVVQADGSIPLDSCTFTRTAPVPPTSGGKGGLQMALSKADTRGSAMLDKAVVNFDEGSPLGKFYFGEQDANLYIPQGGKDYAVVSVGNVGEMPLNFKAKENGEYTLTVSESLNSKFKILNYLHLIDHLTGADVDLLQTPSYTFTARNDDYASRFKLVFNAQQGGEEVDDDFAFISNGEIIINGEGVLQVIDVMGRAIVSVDGRTRCVPTDGMTPGIYVLRLINGENVKTQKIIIK